MIAAIFVMQIVLLAIQVGSMIGSGVVLYKSHKRSVRDQEEHEKRMATLDEIRTVPGRPPGIPWDFAARIRKKP